MTYTPPEGVTIGSFTLDTLPASFRAPADAVISYKIYGTSAGAGVETESGEPYGYKIPLTVESGAQSHDIPIYIGSAKLGAEEYADFGEQKVYKRTEQLFNKNAKDTNNGYVANKYLKSTGEEISDASDAISEYIPIKSNTTYKILYADTTVRYGSPAVCFFDVNKVYISGTAYSNSNPKSFTTPSNAVYIRLSYRQSSINMVTLYEGADSDPTVYQPYLQPTDPPIPFPAINTYKGENTLSSTETLGEVEFTGEWSAIMGSTEDESIDIEFTVDAEEYIAFVTVDDGPSIQVSDTITMPSSADSFTLEVVSWGRERYTETVYSALS